MRYESLESAGQLRVEVSGSPLDVYAFGVLQVNLQDIINKVAYWLLSQEGHLEPTWRRPKYLPARQSFAHGNIIKAEINDIGVGSLFETLGFAVVAVLADPDARAVLQNLGASILWAIGSSGVKGLISKPEKPPANVYPPLLKRKDPLEIGPNLRDAILAIAESRGSESTELRFKYQKSNQEKLEVVIKI